MTWPHYQATVSVIDVFESGACYDGVAKWIESRGIIAGDTATYAPKQKEIAFAAHADGAGAGACTGDGDGAGAGACTGYGYGAGACTGYGYGDGYGDGYGNGYGNGY